MAGVSEREVLEHILDGSMKPTDIELSLLKDMTNKFSEDLKIGQGGFGTVYKGFLGNRTVAVKRIINCHTFDEKLFRREVSNLIDVDQENVVRFLGFCCNTEETLMPFNGKQVYAERRERLLCFEYIGNGSLDKYITDELRGLEWNIRYRIINGIFEGLRYLHQEKGIIHMDLKPENILIDDHMVPKITDFGLSRLENSQTTSTQRFLTIGYCAPEYQFQGKMSLKSDMYSLGVIIVELVTGQKGIPNINNVLRRWRNRWNASARVTPLECKQITKCIEIGLLCLKDDPFDRPSIWEIIEDVRKMECSDGHVISDEKSIVGQVSGSYSDDEMLRIEPLELHFSFKHNKETSCPIHLTNETDSYIFFYIETESSLRYNIEPEKGIVPPRSKSSVRITLQGKDKRQARPFVVRSTQVNEGHKIEEITREIFKKETGYMVDEVILDVFEVHEPIEVQPQELRFPFMASEKNSVSIGIKAVNTTDDYLAVNPCSGVQNVARYYTYPEGAILAPRSTQTLVIRRTAKKDVPQSIECNDKYFILSTAVSKDFDIDDLEEFYEETREDPKWHEIELGVVLEAAYDGMPEVCPSAPMELIQVKQDEVRFPFGPWDGKNFSITLVNITEDPVAFITKVKHDELLWYTTEPKQGILPSCSTLELLVSTDLELGETLKDLPCNDKFYVYSSIVSQDLKATDLNEEFLETQVGRIWYRVDRDIVHVPSWEPIEVQPQELRFPFMASEKNSVSIGIKAVNTTDDYLAVNPCYGVHNVAQYYTYPEGAILAPRSTQTLVIRRTAKKDVPQSIECNDKYFILSTAVSKYFDIDDLEEFYKETREDPKWHEIELGVVLEAAYDGMPEVCPSAPMELIQVKQDEVRFPFGPWDGKNFSITVVNITEDPVAFITKVKHDKVLWYKTEPKQGILPPCSTLELLVSTDFERGKTVKDLPCSDKFYVYSSIVSQDFKASDLNEEFLETQVGRIWYRVDRDIVHVPSSLPTSWSILSNITNIYCMDIHPTEPLMVIKRLSQDPIIYILNYHTEEMTEVLVGPHTVRVAKLIPSKQWIVAGDKEGDIYVYGYDPINKIRVLKEHNDEIRSLAVHPTETYMLSTCEGGKIVLWDIGKDWRVKKTFQTGNYGQLAVFGPKDSDIFAFTDKPGFAIKIRNLHSGECMVELSGHSNDLRCFDHFSHGDDLYMITGSVDKTAKIWDCVTGACVQTLQGHPNTVTTVYCHPDLPLLITGSGDGTVGLWNSTNFSLEWVLNFYLGYVWTIACLKETTRIAIAHDEGIVLADIGLEEPCA